MSKIGDIRQKIIDRLYFLSSHAEDEMLDDNLNRADIERAIFNGRIKKSFQWICVGRDIVFKVRLMMVGRYM